MSPEITRPRTDRRISPVAWVVAGAVALGLTATTPAYSAEPAGLTELVELAEAFAARFWDEDPANDAVGTTEQVRGAMTADTTERLRRQLTEGNGAFVGLGTPRPEAPIQGYRRIRVPLQFENGLLDMRVVFDTDEQVAGLFFVAHEPEVAAAAEEAPVREIEVIVGDEATGLPGTLSIPEGAGPFPGVVLVHGSGPSNRDGRVGGVTPLRDLAWGLTQRGVVVLRYDKRSLARPESLTAAGAELTVQQVVIDDARLALDLLRRRDEVADTRIFVAGHSLGGHLAPRIAEATPRPAGMIVLAGNTLPLPEKIVAQVRYLAEVDGTIEPGEQRQLDQTAAAVASLRRGIDEGSPVTAEASLGAPVGFWRDLERHDPPAIAAGLGLPIFVIQGGRDYQVTIEDFAGWRRSLDGSPAACLQLYPTLDHMLRAGEGPSRPTDYEAAGAVDEALLDDLANWIRGGKCPNS